MNLITISSSSKYLNKPWAPLNEVIEDYIENKKTYYQCLPDDIAFHILTFLPLHNQVSAANISYQFYAISKSIRDKVNTLLTKVYKNIYEYNSKLSSPNNKCTYTFSLWNFNYIFNTKTNITDIQFQINCGWADQEKLVHTDQEKLAHSEEIKQKLEDANCVFFGRCTRQTRRIRRTIKKDFNYKLTFHSDL